MICFEISFNGKPYCTAGVGEFGVLSAFVNYVRVESDDPNVRTGPRWTALSVTGFLSDQSAVHWGDINRMLEVGDEITFRIVESDTHDPWTATSVLPGFEVDDEAE